MQKIMVLSSHTNSLFVFRMDMMRDFIKHGYEVVAVGHESEELWRHKFAENGIEYRQLYIERNGLNPFQDIKTLKVIERLICEEQPQKIFCYQAKTIVYGCIAAKRQGISDIYPLVAGLGSIFRGTGMKNKIIRTVLKLEYKVALANASKVFFQNPDDVNFFVSQKIISNDKTVIINGSGVNTERFYPTDFPSQTNFLMTGRLIKDKGIIEYLEACRKIKKLYPSVRCMLVGPFDTNPSALKPEELEVYINDGTIEYFGEQEDVRSFLEMASVFVLPSYHEGTPKTVLEAMAFGRAIITTDAPGCRETVKDGINGFLVPVKDVEALACKMEEFILDSALCREMGIKGREIAVEKYDIKIVNQSIMKHMGIK